MSSGGGFGRHARPPTGRAPRMCAAAAPPVTLAPASATPAHPSIRRARSLRLRAARAQSQTSRSALRACVQARRFRKLQQLDRWVRRDLPKLLQRRREGVAGGAYLDKGEVARLLTWKISAHAWRPLLSRFVSQNQVGRSPFCLPLPVV